MQCRDVPGRLAGEPQPAAHPVRRNLDVRRHEAEALARQRELRRPRSATSTFTRPWTRTRNCWSRSRSASATAEVTAAFIADLEKRLVRQPVADWRRHARRSRPTVGAPTCPRSRRSFGGSVRHGVLDKELRQPRSRAATLRPQLVNADRINVNGIRDLGDDMHLARRTEQPDDPHFHASVHSPGAWASPRSSKTLPRRPRSTSRFTTSAGCTARSGCTPAMAAGVIDELWSMDDLYLRGD